MKRVYLVLFVVMVLLPGRSIGQSSDVTPIFPYDQRPNTNPEGGGSQIYDVDLYHGSANVRIPIFEYELNGMDLGVSLSYDCRGIKVDQIASTVGLGWTLNAGSFIERDVTGIEDEYVLPAIRGRGLPDISVDSRIDALRGGWVKSLFADYLPRLFPDEEKDGLQIQLAGRSLVGSPVVNYSEPVWKKMLTFPKAELEYQFVYSYVSSGYPYTRSEAVHNGHTELSDGTPRYGVRMEDSSNYFRFNIRDERGTEFAFDRGDYEYKTYKNPDWLFLLDSAIYYPVNNWRIREITTLSNVRVKYHYKRIDNVSYPLFKDEKIRAGGSRLFIMRNKVEYWKGSITVISRIEYPNGTVVHFNYEEDPNKQRLDVSGMPVLLSIVIEQKYDDYSKNAIMYKFNYSYLNAPNAFVPYKEILYGTSLSDWNNYVYPVFRDVFRPDLCTRLKLSNIDRIGTNNIAEPYFSFEYNSMDLPARLSPRKDFFGYYNGELSTPLDVSYKEGPTTKEILVTNLSIPFHEIYTRIGDEYKTIIYGVKKHHNLTHMKAGVLTKVKNQYGGVTSFFYKDHVLSNKVNIFYESYEDRFGASHIRPVNIMTGQVGEHVNDGLCIDRISYEDGYNGDNSYTTIYSFSNGERFFPGGYMSYFKHEKDYSVVGYPKCLNVYYHSYNISRHKYHNGFNHGYYQAEVKTIGKNLQELSRDRYTYSTLSGPYWLPRVPRDRKDNANLQVLIYSAAGLPSNALIPDHSYAPSFFHLHNLGLLLSHTSYYPASNQPKTEKYYTREYFVSNKPWEQSGIRSNFYSYSSSYQRSTSLFTPAVNKLTQLRVVQNSDIIGAQKIESIFQYEYDTFENVTLTKWKDSKGNPFSRRYTYSYQVPTGYGGFAAHNQYLINATTTQGVGTGARIVDVEETIQHGLSLGRPNVFRSLKATAPVPNGTPPVITDDKKYTAKDDHANVLETQHDGLDRYTSSIWDTRIGKKVAEATNARYAQIAYTSFEGAVKGYGTVPADPSKGNWEYYPEDIKHKSTVSRSPVTGNYLLEIGNGSTHRVETRNSFEIGGKYILSFWANMLPQVQLIPDGAGANVAITPELVRSFPDGWGLYQAIFEVAQVKRRVRITNSNPYTALHLDELRLHPVDAGMTTTTYEPLWGPNAVCDERHDITYYEYDPFGRLALIRDRDSNILRKYEEIIQKADYNGAPLRQTYVWQPEALAYIHAIEKTTVLSMDVKLTIDTLVRDLKGLPNPSHITYNVWNDILTFYPVIGNTASTHAYNLKDTGASKITWVGSPLHSASGVSFNGVNQYANTNFNPNERVSIGAYVNGGTLAGSTYNNFIARDKHASGPYNFFRISSNYGGQRYLGTSQSAAVNMDLYPAPVAVDYGMYQSIETSSGVQIWKDLTSVGGNATTTFNSANLNYFIGALNRNGGPAWYWNGRIACVYFAKANLNTNKAASLCRTITHLQRKLGRHAEDSTYDWQPEALAYINAIEQTVMLTDTVKLAIDTLVRDLKGLPNPRYTTHNIWSQMDVIYPFVGGSAAAHKWNLKDPRDLDAAYRLVFYGSPTHSASGVHFTGVTGNYANTFYKNNTRVSLGVDVNGGTLTGVGIYPTTFGAEGSPNLTQSLQLTVRNAGTPTSLFCVSGLTSGTFVESTNGGVGYFYQGVCTPTGIILKKDNLDLVTNSNTAYCANGLDFWLGSINGWSGGYQNVRISYAHIVRENMTEAQATALYHAVRNFNTKLSR